MTNKSPVWHPFTQHALFPDSISVDRAKGAYLYTKGGDRIIDAISSWWVNTHGHCHPRIVEAVRLQAEQLDQVIFAGFTHEPAEQLAEKLVAITPAPLQHVFFSDSGSTSVEVALKMAIGAWAHRGQPRATIVAMEHAYHGDTFAAMAAGARGVFNDAYAPFLFDVARLPFPDRDGANTLAAFGRLIDKRGSDIAALIAEPLVLGAGGMQMYGADVLKGLREMCDKAGVFLIADEVMTGWGRTGTMFACQQAGISPDILCLSKGLTGGFLPLAVTLATDDIYNAFYSPDRMKTFFHSSSYTGNAVACAAANAALDVWEEEPVMERIQAIAQTWRDSWPALAAHPCARNFRQCGTIAALDVAAPDNGYLSNIGPFLYSFFLKRGLLLRPLGNTIYVLPPYCVTKDDCHAITQGIAAALDAVRDGRTE